MNGHEQIKALIAVYDSLSRTEKARVQQHVETCPTCQASLAAYQQIDLSIADLVDPKPQLNLRRDFYTRLEAERSRSTRFVRSFPTLFQRLSAQVAQAGALAVIAVLVFSMWLALRSQPNQPAAVPTLAPSRPQPTASVTPQPTATMQPPAAPPSPVPPAWTIELRATLSDQLNVVRAVSFGQEGKIIAANGSSNQSVVWELAEGTGSYQPQMGLDYIVGVRDLAYSAGGYLAVGGAAGVAGFVSIYDESGEVMFSLPTAVSTVERVAFSNSGEIIALGTDSGRADGGTVQLWFLQYSDRLYELPYEGGDVTDLAFSLDDTLVAAAFESGVSIWQVAGNGLVQTLTAENESSTFSSLAFSADGQRVAGGTRAGLVYIWQVADGQLLYQFDTGTKPLQSLAFSADGQQFATAAADGQVTVWQFGEANPQLQFRGQTADRVGLSTDIVFVDGTVLAAVGLANGQVQLWQIAPSGSSPE